MQPLFCCPNRKVKELKKLVNINDLIFVRVIDPAVFQIIPRYLFEQIKEMDAVMIDHLYQFASEILTIPVVNENGQLIRIPNPIVCIAVLHDIARQIKGFLWAEIDIIERHIFVQACSVYKEYQSNNGEVERRMVKYLFDLSIPPEFKTKIKMATLRPKVFEEKFGWNRSKTVLMEISNVESKITEPDGKD